MRSSARELGPVMFSARELGLSHVLPHGELGPNPALKRFEPLWTALNQGFWNYSKQFLETDLCYIMLLYSILRLRILDNKT
jgi:hypothetical protein